MSQNVAAATSLGGATRRHHRGGNDSQDLGGASGTSMSARYGDTEWEAREVCNFLFRYILDFFMLYTYLVYTFHIRINLTKMAIDNRKIYVIYCFSKLNNLLLF